MAADPPRERLPTLDGSRNFRDLGGYPTQDGRHTRWGLLYRSGSLFGLTQAARDRFSTLGIRALCDLRTARERTAEPYEWCEAAGITVWSRDYETSFAELRALMSATHVSGPTAHQAMLAGYRELPYEQAPAYRELFRCLAAGETPLVFNCSAGKDRAGTAAALVLSALGVPREIVVEDYALSDKVVDFKRVFFGEKRATYGLGAQPDAAIDAVLASDPLYIEAALDSLAEKSGSLEAYLSEHLGVTPHVLRVVQENLLA